MASLGETISNSSANNNDHDDEEFRARAVLALAPLGWAPSSDVSSTNSSIHDYNSDGEVQGSPGAQGQRDENAADAPKKQGGDMQLDIEAIKQDNPGKETPHKHNDREDNEKTLPNKSWIACYNELVEYKREFGHCRVPQKYKPNPQLLAWVRTQRICFKKKSLSKDRIAKLNELGFVWQGKGIPLSLPSKVDWATHYNELMEYKREYGNCNVPRGYKSNPRLGNWVNTQRKKYKSKLLSDDRIEQLNDLGFVWHITDAPQKVDWMKRYNELVKFKREFGNCKVPQRYHANPSLGTWVNRLRQKFNKGTLSDELVAKLNELEFSWEARDVPQENLWMLRYNELAEYKREFGHCNVPYSYIRKSNPQLCSWVGEQRRRFKNKYLSDDRIAKLNELGFVWENMQQKSA